MHGKNLVLLLAAMLVVVRPEDDEADIADVSGWPMVMLLHKVVVLAMAQSVVLSVLVMVKGAVRTMCEDGGEAWRWGWWQQERAIVLVRTGAFVQVVAGGAL